MKLLDPIECIGGRPALAAIFPCIIDPCLETLQALLPRHLVVFEHAQARAHDLADILVAALRNLLLHELLEVVAEADARHVRLPCRRHLMTIDNTLGLECKSSRSAISKGDTMLCDYSRLS